MYALNMPCYYKITKVNFSKWNHPVVLFIFLKWVISPAPSQELYFYFVLLYYFNEPNKPFDKDSVSLPFWVS